jgi:hypothetical protein
MCLVRDAKCVGSKEDYPELKNTDYIMKEFRGERTAAMELVTFIEIKENLTDHDIRTELRERVDRDWFGPGDVMNLAYLSERISHT